MTYSTTGWTFTRFQCISFLTEVHAYIGGGTAQPDFAALVYKETDLVTYAVFEAVRRGLM